MISDVTNVILRHLQQLNMALQFTILISSVGRTHMQEHSKI